MDASPLKFIEPPPSPLQKAGQDRILDWEEDGKNIDHLLELHEEKYRIKICANCNDTQKKIRGCCVDSGLDSNGNPKTYCDHMHKAGYQKLKDRVFKHIDFHPLFYNPE